MDQLIKDLESKLKAILENLKIELGGIRTNRPHPQLVSDVKVNYNESQLTVKQLGSISVNPPRELLISLWDTGAVPSVAKALQESVAGASVSIDGHNVRVNLPPLSDERRKELIKTAKALTEERRIKVRSSRDEINKKLERMEHDHEISEDMKFKGKKRIQDIIDRVGKEIDSLLAAKVKDIES